MNKQTRNKMLRYIENSYHKIDFAMMAALASCAIEGNPMYNRVGKVYGWIWGDERVKTIPTDEEIESVYLLMKKVK